MKIALTCPTFWPYYRRGGDRYLNDLARYLHLHGHEVTIITSKPGRPRRVKKDGIDIIYGREYSHPLLPLNFRYLTFAWNSFRAITRERFDIVHSLFFSDAFGARLSRYFPFCKNHIFYITIGNPFHWDDRISRVMFESAVRSSVVLVPSYYLKKSLNEYYGIEAEVIPPGIDSFYFRSGGEKSFDPPKILCMAVLSEPRKRVSLLVKAFERLKFFVSDAVLQLSGRFGQKALLREMLESVRPGVRDSIELIGLDKKQSIRDLYARAAMTVLPSLKEPFGMVLVESLAAGTPIVATKDGGIPEIIDDPRVGVMFGGEGEEAVDALCEAMLRCLELARDPATSAYCRGHSMRYDWASIGPKYEDLYRTVAGKS